MVIVIQEGLASLKRPMSSRHGLDRTGVESMSWLSGA
jgi:hypothetical protein